MTRFAIQRLIIFESIFVILVLCLGIFFFFRPTIVSNFHNSQTGIGDTILNNFFLEHSWQLIFNKSYQGTAWSPQYFYPAKNVLTYSDTLWGSAPLYWLGRVFFTPESAFQFWMILVSTLNFISLYLVARKFKIYFIFSAWAAFLFAFGMPRLMQLGHQQLLPQFFSVVALYFLFTFFETTKHTYLYCFEVCAYLQMLAGIYLGWFLLFSVPFFAFFYWIFTKNTPFLKAILRPQTMVSVLFFLLALSTTFYPYFRTQNEIGPRSYNEVRTMIPSIISYLSIPPHSILQTWSPKVLTQATQRLPMLQEHYMSPGIFVILFFFLSLIGLLIIQKRTVTTLPTFVLPACTVFLLITFISLRIPFTGVSLWKYVYLFVPGASALRAISRICTISYLYLFLALALVASTVFTQSTSRTFKSLLALLSIFSCFEQVNLQPFNYSKLEQKSIQNQIKSLVAATLHTTNANAFYIRWPATQSYLLFQLKAMWASLELGVPTVNGYSGNVPMGYKNFTYTMTDDEINSWIKKFGYAPESQKILVLDLELNQDLITVNMSSLLHLPKK